MKTKTNVVDMTIALDEAIKYVTAGEVGHSLLIQWCAAYVTADNQKEMRATFFERWYSLRLFADAPSDQAEMTRLKVTALVAAGSRHIDGSPEARAYAYGRKQWATALKEAGVVTSERRGGARQSSGDKAPKSTVTESKPIEAAPTLPTPSDAIEWMKAHRATEMIFLERNGTILSKNVINLIKKQAVELQKVLTQN